MLGKNQFKLHDFLEVVTVKIDLKQDNGVTGFSVTIKCNVTQK